MRKIISFCLMLTLMAMPTVLNAQKKIYVSKTTGNNRNEGTMESPLKNLQKAIDIATEGDQIFVAEGNYFGSLDCGTLKINKPLQIFGGYNTTFTNRDILRYKTMVQPTAESNGTVSMGTICIDIPQQSQKQMIFDGFIIDRGNCNAYNAAGEGKPEGVESPMLMPIGGKGIGGPDLKNPNVISSSTPTMRLNVKCPTIIRNCAFINSFQYAILGSAGVVKVDIVNNIFINQTYAAVQISGSMANGRAEIQFAYNTVLFSWARTKDLGDMGYGYRYMNGTNVDVHHCIIGCSTFAGLDRTYSENSREKEAEKKTGAENNLFFLNRQADLTLPGGGMFQRVWVKDFEDVEQLYKYEGNKSITDPAVFTRGLDLNYLKGFINVSYKEKVDYDPNSGANQFRESLGMNKQGTIKSSVTMFANRYPWETAIQLFGAVKDYGAQLPK